MATAGKDVVCRVGIKVPPFWPNEPALWFSQLEGQFALANITADATKFYHVTANLDYKYICEVKDVVSKPPSEGKYEKIKTELISRLSTSQQQRVRQLLTHEELGDRKPSQFLRHLQSLAGEDVPEQFIRSIWVSRLPDHVQAIMATQGDLPLESIARIVDKIYEIAPQLDRQVAATSQAGTPTSSIDLLTRRIDDLSRQVAALSTTSSSRSRYRGHSPRWRHRSRSRSNAGPGHCWFHRRFGSKATKCRAPCSFPPGNERRSQ
ncbi:unnamed protein product [Pieris macdunnoughi]|uniref:DUF7041 domain-containing protein n=1 Tax=Pieris macdunnoughi TaxID=345717 RepID=A0A821XQM0_9NEOP|nr:unnamed protein product [Pieris macdunnoughi]